MELGTYSLGGVSKHLTPELNYKKNSNHEHYPSPWGIIQSKIPQQLYLFLGANHFPQAVVRNAGSKYNSVVVTCRKTAALVVDGG